MKRRSISVLLMFAVVLFAAVSLGGCGGSSSSVPPPDSGTTEGSDLSMYDVWNNGEGMFDRLTSEDIFKMFVLRTEEIVREADGSITMQHFDVLRNLVSNEEYPKVPYNKEELLAHYNSEDIIIIHQPDQKLVNIVRSDLGLSEEDADTFGQSGSLEVYGLACIKIDGLRNLFVYVVPRMGDIIASNDTSSEEANIEPIAVSADIDLPEIVSEDNAADDNAEVVTEEYTMRDFQLDRWANFFRWMGNLAIEAFQNVAFASSYQVMAADDDATDITAICDAQSRTFDFSYANIHADGPNFDGQHYQATEFERTRNNFVSVKIYAAHSFTSGNDYYIVDSTTTTEPKNFADKQVVFDRQRFNYLYGFTDNVRTQFYIDGGDMSTSDVALAYSAPDIDKITGTYTMSALRSSWLLMYWADYLWGLHMIDRQFSVKKDGVSANVDGMIRYSPRTTTWTVDEYTIENLYVDNKGGTRKAWAGWYVDVNKPITGESLNNQDGWDKGEERNFYWDVNATAVSTKKLQYDSYFVWEVGRDYWKNHPDMKMNLIFSVGDGVCMGGFTAMFEAYSRYDCAYMTHKEDSLKLEQPPHTAVDKTNFEFTSAEATTGSFTLFAEDDWELTTNADWLHFTSTSGSETGGSGKKIVFDVDENTDTSPREAVVTITSGRDTVNLTVRQTGK